MILHRFALILFDTKLPRVEAWGYETRDGVKVAVQSVHNVGDAVPAEGLTFIAPRRVPETEPTSILLVANITTTVAVVDPSQVRLPDAPRVAAERALSEMAAMIGIQSEAPWRIVSPRPYLALSSESDAERELLKSSKRIVLPSVPTDSPMHGQGIGEVGYPIHLLLKDRRDGVVLLGAAVRVGGGVAKLHELFRVFENGFGRAGVGLIEPLTKFLQSYPGWDLEYTRSEVEFWVNRLRHPATHADLKKSSRVAYDVDVERYLFRIEQAAYDVLFNKAKWNTGDVGREMRWSFSVAQQGGGRLLADPKTGHMRLSLAFDHFGAFPLAEGMSVQLPAVQHGAEFLPGDWYFSEEDWQLFQGGEHSST